MRITGSLGRLRIMAGKGRTPIGLAPTGYSRPARPERPRRRSPRTKAVPQNGNAVPTQRFSNLIFSRHAIVVAEDGITPLAGELTQEAGTLPGGAQGHFPGKYFGGHVIAGEQDHVRLLA